MSAQMHLAFFSGHGLGPGPVGWTDDRMPEQLEWDRPEMYIEMSKMLERSGYDFVLFADTFGIPDDYRGAIDTYVEYAVAMPKMDPAILAPMITAGTTSIGVVPTLSTLYYPPYLLARLTATLDHVMEGRLGMNMVTSANERAAQNFGLDNLPEHDLRYEMADEYMDVVNKLWETWEPDALLLDVENGLFADPSKVHPVDHDGKHYRVKGLLNVSSTPQGRPLLVQAGSSGAGIAFAARHADVVITNQNSVEDMKAFREQVRAAAVDAGRSADDVKVLFIISPVIAESADALQVDHHRGTGTSRLELGLAQLSTNLGNDMSKHPLDEPISFRKDQVGGSRSTLDQFRTIDGKTPTLRQVAEFVGAHTSIPLAGTAEQVADRMQEIFEATGGDGFAIRGNWVPSLINDVAVQLGGILMRRGLVAPPEPSLTLRERVRGTKAGTLVASALDT
jgi:FMN-dependent oxidoreductase (nitrilotriacetate monooxygenase family)